VRSASGSSQGDESVGEVVDVEAVHVLHEQGDAVGGTRGEHGVDLP
jgi:hypothetical protein